MIFLLIAGISYALVNKFDTLKDENTKIREQQILDEARILSLENELYRVKRDTAYYRKVIVDLQPYIAKLKKIDKESSKGLAEEFPTLEQLKNNLR